VRQTPRVIKNAIAPRRRVRFILAQEYTGPGIRGNRKKRAALKLLHQS
jgi:hypothetical protein